MRDDEIRLRLADDLDQTVVLFGIGTADGEVINIAGHDLESADSAGILRLLCADLAQLVGHNDQMTHVAVGNVADGDIVAALFTAQQRAAAVELHIVRMTDDG